MLFLLKRPALFCGLPLLVLLSGCGAKPECDSPETRDAVLKAVASDDHNPLIKYAQKGSAEAKSNDANAQADQSKRPLYALGEKIVTNSTSQDKRTLQCSGSISATVGEAKASKEIDFSVQQASDGKISVSVVPFQF